MKIVCGMFKKGGVQYDVDGDLPEPCSDAQATARGQIERPLRQRKKWPILAPCANVINPDYY
jgi:hypothetical protein